ncbi:MAG: hypothetical protein KBG22_03320 [Smithella sp.]|nr:hypothetical protein [Smithella sp.]
MASDFQPDWNISPGQYIAAIVQRDGENILESFCWGLIPSWADSVCYPHNVNIENNAIFRTVFINFGFLYLGQIFHVLPAACINCRLPVK